MPVQRDVACRFCQHATADHSEIVGCTSAGCTCMATAGEATPRTADEWDREPLTRVAVSPALPVHVCLLTHQHYAHDWWYTSEGGGHMVSTPEDATLLRGAKQWHCPGVAPVTPPSNPIGAFVASNQYRDAVATANAHETWVCPRCDHPTGDYPSLSRRDNSTAVCGKCGTEEAMRQFAGLEAWPTEGTWPFMWETGR